MQGFNQHSQAFVHLHLQRLAVKVIGVQAEGIVKLARHINHCPYNEDLRKARDACPCDVLVAVLTCKRATSVAREACRLSERRGMEPARTRLTWPGGNHAGLAPALGTIVIQLEAGRPRLSRKRPTISNSIQWYPLLPQIKLRLQ